MNLQTRFQRHYNANQTVSRAFRKPSDQSPSAPAPSAAWLAAQGAFSEVQPKRPATAPDIIVRKNRILVAPETAPEHRIRDGVAAAKAKSPRVFLIGTPRADAGLGAAADTAEVSLPITSPVRPRRKRSGPSAVNFSGPVLQIYKSESVSVQPTLSHVAVVGLSPVQATLLLKKLGAVTRALEESQQAADIHFADVHEAKAWQRLCIDLRLVRQLADAAPNPGNLRTDMAPLVRPPIRFR